MAAYYNEIDKNAAAWLRELIKQGHIAPGEVDERSVEDVLPSELTGFTQCHFFAGIGVWSYALRRAGWPDDRPVWTGSCPCQPFSAAGKRGGTADERHLWPAFHWLVQQCRPDVVFGEQVASNNGLAWLDIVSTDLEETGYTFGAADLCAAGLGAPHIRQRLFWVGDSKSVHGRLSARQSWRPDTESIRTSKTSNLGDADNQRPQGYGQSGNEHGAAEWAGTQRHAATTGFWANAAWVYCRDAKWRAVEPGSFPLAYGPTARVGRLRGYGNAIVAPVAQAFIEAYLEVQ